MRNQPSFLMVQDDCPATLCKRCLRPSPSAADGVDRGLPNSRLHLIERWPGGLVRRGKSRARFSVIAGFTPPSTPPSFYCVALRRLGGPSEW
jgi:hypothetical protein